MTHDSTTFTVGSWVRVKDEHDIPATFREGPTKGRVAEIFDNGAIEVWIPIGDADVDEHSQAVFYEPHMLEAVDEREYAGQPEWRPELGPPDPPPSAGRGWAT